MEHGKDPLVSPSAEWVRDYHSEVDRRSSSPSSSSSSTNIRRRHRRRITHQTKYARRRVVRMVLVCSALFVIMALLIFFMLSREEVGGHEGSRRAPVNSVGGHSLATLARCPPRPRSLRSAKPPSARPACLVMRSAAAL